MNQFKNIINKDSLSANHEKCYFSLYNLLGTNYLFINTANYSFSIMQIIENTNFKYQCLLFLSIIILDYEDFVDDHSTGHSGKHLTFTLPHCLILNQRSILSRYTLYSFLYNSFLYNKHIKSSNLIYKSFISQLFLHHYINFKFI